MIPRRKGNGHEPSVVMRMRVRTLVFLGYQLLFMGQTPAPPAFEDVSFETSSKYKGKAIRLRGELLRPPANHKLPAVVLMHGCSGWLPAAHAALRTHSQYLAQHGFIVLNLDSSGPRGNVGELVCEDAQEASDAIEYRTEDAFDAMAFLRSRPDVDGRNIFLMGQGLGAIVALRTAVLDRRGFRAVAAFYPHCFVLQNVSPLKLAAIVFAGEKDDWTPAFSCTIAKGIDRMPGADFELIVYPGAVHGFDLEIKIQTYIRYLVGHDAHAASDSRARMLAFFKRHMASPGAK